MTGQFLFVGFAGLVVLPSPLWPVGAVALCVGMLGLGVLFVKNLF